MTQSSPYIRLNYSGFSICACVSLSAACTELYEQIVYSLTFSLPHHHHRGVVDGGGDGGGDDGVGVKPRMERRYF